VSRPKHGLVPYAFSAAGRSAGPLNRHRPRTRPFPAFPKARAPDRRCAARYPFPDRVLCLPIRPWGRVVVQVARPKGAPARNSRARPAKQTEAGCRRESITQESARDRGRRGPPELGNGPTLERDALATMMGGLALGPAHQFRVVATTHTTVANPPFPANRARHARPPERMCASINPMFPPRPRRRLGPTQVAASFPATGGSHEAAKFPQGLDHASLIGGPGFTGQKSGPYDYFRPPSSRFPAPMSIGISGMAPEPSNGDPALPRSQPARLKTGRVRVEKLGWTIRNPYSSTEGRRDARVVFEYEPRRDCKTTDFPKWAPGQ